MDNMIGMLSQLTIIIATCLAIIFLLNLYFNTESGKKIPPSLAQVFMGIILGVLASVATYFNVNVIGDEVVSIRNAIVLSAGFIFGAPAGIISGIISAAYRYFVFDMVDTHAQMASTITTLIAACCGGALRVLLFDRKAPRPLYGLFIGINIEILHILLIILASIKDIYSVFIGIKLYTIPMIAINSIFTALALAVTSHKNKDKSLKKTKLKSITQSFEEWLAICLVVALALSTASMWFLQTRISDRDTASLLRVNLNDVREDILVLHGSNLKGHGYSVALNVVTNNYVGQGGGVILADNKEIVLSERNGYQGKSLASVGLLLNKAKEYEVFHATLDSIDYECMYSRIDEFYVIAIIPLDNARFARNLSVYLSAFMQVLVLAVMFSLIYILVKRLVIDNIQKVNHSLAEIASDNLNTLVDIRTNEEFSMLSDDINATVASLKRHIEAEKNRLDEELEFAKTIQFSSLPSIFPPYPHRDEFDVFACMHTAKEVGGDFYDFYFIDEDNFAFLVADVSGKGIPAAIFMMKAKTLIKSFVEAGHAVDEVFSMANTCLCENNKATMFVTAWLGILNVKTGMLSYVNAGHNPPLIRYVGGEFEYLKTKANFVLALAEDVPYKRHNIQLSNGAEIFLYTDGITEAYEENGELYGEGRLKNILDKNHVSSKEMCANVLDDVNNFVGEVAQADDITMLALFLQKKMEFTIDIHPVKENILTVTDFVNKHLERHGCTPKVQAQINIALDEILSNIINYSSIEQASNINIQLEIIENPRAVIIQFTDSGVPFNPLLNINPDIALPADMRKIGGLGIYLVKQLMDDVWYEYNNSQNILRIKKKL